MKLVPEPVEPVPIALAPVPEPAETSSKTGYPLSYYKLLNKPNFCGLIIWAILIHSSPILKKPAPASLTIYRWPSLSLSLQHRCGTNLELGLRDFQSLPSHHLLHHHLSHLHLHLLQRRFTGSELLIYGRSERRGREKEKERCLGCSDRNPAKRKP